MKKHQKQIFAIAVTLVFTAAVILLTGLSAVGEDDKPDSVMDMLEDIYDIVLDTNSKLEGVLIQRTGQTTCYAADGTIIDCAGTGQDGEFQYGAPWPEPRFTDNSDGTVTDNLTHLMWTQNAQRFSGSMSWDSALSACNNLELSDYTDWNLPNLRELHSLIDYSRAVPYALPHPHPFDNVMPNYWSSTSSDHCSGACAWYVNIGMDRVTTAGKTSTTTFAWCVRGGR